MEDWGSSPSLFSVVLLRYKRETTPRNSVAALREFIRELGARMFLARRLGKQHHVAAFVRRGQVHRILGRVFALERERLRVEREALDHMQLVAVARGGHEHTR